MKSEERVRLIQIGHDYNCEIVFTWRNRGIQTEVLKMFKYGI
jgi:hypothetical protein